MPLRLGFCLREHGFLEPGQPQGIYAADPGNTEPFPFKGIFLYPLKTKPELVFFFSSFFFFPNHCIFTFKTLIQMTIKLELSWGRLSAGQGIGAHKSVSIAGMLIASASVFIISESEKQVTCQAFLREVN